MLRWLLILLCVPELVWAQAESPLRFYVWSDNLAPIIAQDPASGEFSGIVVDIFNALPPEDAVNVQYVLHNRTRGELALYAGTLHATILSREWLAEPDKLLFSLPIYVHVEYLYSAEPIVNKSLNSLIRNRHICTRRGYRYPKLKRYFDKRLAMRIDSHSEESMLRMLLFGRCDYAVSNEFVAGWLIDHFGWTNAIYTSPKPVDKVNFTLAFHPSKAPVMVKLNTHIESLTRSGKLQQIIQRHRAEAAAASKKAVTEK